jgi:hypothetical protein
MQEVGSEEKRQNKRLTMTAWPPYATATTAASSSSTGQQGGQKNSFFLFFSTNCF